jgi:NhaP-type Na+/H+ or K+/H+ antiporter
MDGTTGAIAVLAAGLLVVAGAAAFGPRLRIPAPLILVVVGILLSLLPFVRVTVSPDLVLNGILPPLLYASSVSMPSMDLRREFGAISGLSVALVVVSSVLLGWLFTLLIPGLPLALGIALGAVISPTDAVATSIVKSAKVSHRVTAILEGESLLNDASALVVLRTAIGAVGTGIAAISAPIVVRDFAWSLIAAIVIGIVVGRLTLLLRARVTSSSVNTVISFAVPFIASLPAELVGASGLVAAVAAGLAVGRNAPRKLSAEHRRSDSENWSTVNLLLEGSIFLLMGLEISGIVKDAGGAATVLTALPVALAGLAGVIVIRALFVTPLLLLLKGGSRRGEQRKQQLEEFQQALADGGQAELQRRADTRRGPKRRVTQIDTDRFTQRIRQSLNDIDYLAASPLGPRESVVVVWAGMRGAVTVAAAQTIDVDSKYTGLVILVAFGVAAISLLVQGGTLSPLIRLLKPKGDDPEAKREEQQRILRVIQESSGFTPPPNLTDDGKPRDWKIDERLQQIQKSRDALLDARDEGVFSADVLGNALASLDAMELAIDVRRNGQV